MAQFRNKDAMIIVRVHSDVKEALFAAAAEDRRSASSLLELLVVRGLERLGHYPPKAKGKRAAPRAASRKGTRR